MSDLASLLPGIAAVITSLSGAFVAIFAITRGSKREREKAAQSAIDRVLSGGDEDDELAAVLEEILQRRKDDES